MPLHFFKAQPLRLAWIPLVVIAVSLVTWFTTRETLPATIRVATAHEGGLYHEFGQALKDSLEAKTGRSVEILETDGSLENARLLREGQADLAIIQGGAVSSRKFAVIAPLYPEVVHVLTRSDSSIRTLDDLKGARVACGPPESGMRTSAGKILTHYGILESIEAPTHQYFEHLQDEAGVDAAIVTTGFMNRDLQKMMAEGDYQLLPLRGAQAIATKDPFFTVAKIPRGLYREGPSVPPDDVPTVATTALLVTSADASERLVEETLDAIYTEGLGLDFPTLIARQEALTRSPVPLHPLARRFFNPPDQIGRFATLMEALAGFKELTVAGAAGLYLLWKRRKTRRDRQLAERVQEDKDRLDVYLEKTLEIERAQMEVSDAAELGRLLDQVTRIKLEALTKFTHEELRSDQTFSIFLLQCSNLISTLQMKALQASTRWHEAGAGDLKGRALPPENPDNPRPA